MKSFRVLTFVGFCCLPYPAWAEPFGLPDTSAERALDHVLDVDANDPEAFDSIFPAASGKVPLPRITSLFTPRLLQSIRRAEKEEVDRDCDGRYIKGELCGLGFRPVLCAQDYEQPFQFRSVSQTDDEARIEYRWPREGDSPIASFRMVRHAGRWKLDGIRCVIGGSFND